MPATQYITLEEAVQMTSLYREQRNEIVKTEYSESNLLAICETFDRSVFDTLLSQEDCSSVRIYFGMDVNLQIHSIVVGVNKENQDQLPDSGNFKIAENAYRCPEVCPPASALNS